MSSLALGLGLGGVAVGVAILLYARRRPVVNAAAVIAELEEVRQPLDGYEERLAEPLLPRVLGPAGRKVAQGILGLLPRNYLESLRRRMVVAGALDRMTPEDFVAAQAIALTAGLLVGLGGAAAAGFGAVGAIRLSAIVGAAAAAAPEVWLRQKRDQRQMEIRRDLPDILDLLVISVEAGLGLEGAIQIVGNHFSSPMARELARMLKEIELGLPRRSALQNLKRRTGVPEVSNLVLSLIQAEALGMPVGKVLRTQANELRLKRRQAARERAAKLPIKILFPLLLFIFPSLFVVILGPAVVSITSTLLR